VTGVRWNHKQSNFYGHLHAGKVVFATSPQQHYFDCPYQFSSSEGGQSASDAAVTFSSKRAHYFFRRDAGYMHTIDWWN
jgi:hypothetical protein